jgi:hypothetical protein
LIRVRLKLVGARRLEHEATKTREACEARRPRSDRTSAFSHFVLRAFVAFRGFVFQTLLTIINQF